MLINRKNIFLLLRTLFIVILLIALKLFIHKYFIEFITINNLFSGIIAANIFLMSFLLSGVLSDFKESEKIPGEIAVSLSILYEDIDLLEENKSILTLSILNKVKGLSILINKWFHRECSTRDILHEIKVINTELSKYDGKIQVNYIIRFKQELATIKKWVIRTDTIRDTNFISSGYLIATLITIIMCFGLIFSKIDPFIESIFFVGSISFLMIFLLLLIHDLDNPFDYKSHFSIENISLYPLGRFISSIE